MNATIEFDTSAYETLELFAQATNVGMFPGEDDEEPVAIVERSPSGELVLALRGVNRESLFALRRMLIVAGTPLPAELRDLPGTPVSLTIEERLQPSIRDLVSLVGVNELSGDAFFTSVRGESSTRIYDAVFPVTRIWQDLLSKQAFPYRCDEDSIEPFSTEGIEIYESSDIAVEVATTSYGGDEEGIAALLNAMSRQLQNAGLSFRIECWTG